MKALKAKISYMIMNYIAQQMSMMLCGQTKYSPFSKGITIQGPDPAEANTK